jgi:peptide/nickel transport system substrate-binding protein
MSNSRTPDAAANAGTAPGPRRSTRGPAVPRVRATTVLAVSVSCLMAAMLAGCGSSTPARTATTPLPASPASVPATGAAMPAKSGGTVTVGLPAGGIDHLEPTLWYFQTSWQVAYATCTPLMTFADSSGPAGGKAVPGLADQPTVSADGLTYTFVLKPGVTFADGRPISGADIKDTFDRMLSPALASPGASFFGDIAGAQAVIKGKAKTVSGITAKGNTVVFKLARPVGSFLYRMTMPFTCPVPKGTPRKPIENGKALLTGPYIVKSYTPQRSLVLVRNPHFSAAALGRRGTADEIDLKIGVDPSQAGPLVRSGGIATFGGALAAADAQQALADGTLKGQVFVQPLPATTYLWLNNDVAPFNNVAVRQAVNYAINRLGLVRVWGGPSQATPTDQVLPPTMPGWKDASIYPPGGDQAKAKALMQQSGVKTPVHVVLRTLSDQAGYAQAAQVVQSQLKPLGIDVEIKTAPDSVNQGIISVPKNRISMGINTWSQDYPDPDDFLVPLLDGRNITPTGNNNLASFNNSAVSTQIAGLESSTSTDRQAQWNTLDAQIMKDNAPWAPLFNQTRVSLYAKGICGAVIHPVYEVDLAKLGRCG